MVRINLIYLNITSLLDSPSLSMACSWTGHSARHSTPQQGGAAPCPSWDDSFARRRKILKKKRTNRNNKEPEEDGRKNCYENHLKEFSRVRTEETRSGDRNLESGTMVMAKNTKNKKRYSRASHCIGALTDLSRLLGVCRNHLQPPSLLLILQIVQILLLISPPPMQLHFAIPFPLRMISR